jgi:hypothetical protein
VLISVKSFSALSVVGLRDLLTFAESLSRSLFGNYLVNFLVNDRSLYFFVVYNLL